MFCKNCGSEMHNEQAICLKCGVKKGVGVKNCGGCGKQVEPDASVCLSCGRAIKSGVSNMELPKIPKVNSDFINEAKSRGELPYLAALGANILAVLSLFLPVLTAGSIKVNGIDILFGTGDMNGGNFLMLFVWIFPLIPLLTKFVEPLKKFAIWIFVFSPIIAEIFIFAVESGIKDDNSRINLGSGSGSIFYKIFINIAWLISLFMLYSRNSKKEN